MVENFESRYMGPCSNFCLVVEIWSVMVTFVGKKRISRLSSMGIFFRLVTKVFTNSDFIARAGLGWRPNKRVNSLKPMKSHGLIIF